MDETNLPNDSDQPVVDMSLGAWEYLFGNKSMQDISFDDFKSRLDAERKIINGPCYLDTERNRDLVADMMRDFKRCHGETLTEEEQKYFGSFIRGLQFFAAGNSTANYFLNKKKSESDLGDLGLERSLYRDLNRKRDRDFGYDR